MTGECRKGSAVGRHKRMRSHFCATAAFPDVFPGPPRRSAARRLRRPQRKAKLCGLDAFILGSGDDDGAFFMAVMAGKVAEKAE